MTKTTKTCDCPKCGGSGYISAFSGIAGGMCFRCAGKGKIAYRASAVKPVPPLTEQSAKIIETIKSGDLSGMTYGQLNRLRDFAHWPCPHCPELLSIWRERGDPYFFAAQEEKLAEFYANR